MRIAIFGLGYAGSDDPDMALGAVFGRNRAYLEENLPHGWTGAVGTLDEAVADAGVIVVGKGVPGLDRLGALRRPEQTIVDLVGIADLPGALRPWGVRASAPRPTIGSCASG